jgi:hypothetical protein
VSITIAGIKLRYLPKLTDSTDQDAVLTALMSDVVARAIDYLDSDSYSEESELTSVIESAIMKQVAYEFNRRRDLGLTSVTAPDGTQSRFANDDWLPDVKATLDRYANYTIALGADDE